MQRGAKQRRSQDERTSTKSWCASGSARASARGREERGARTSHPSRRCSFRQGRGGARGRGQVCRQIGFFWRPSPPACVTQRESTTRTSVHGSTNGKRKRGSSRIGDGCRVLERTKRNRRVFVDATSAGVSGPGTESPGGKRVGDRERGTDKREDRDTRHARRWVQGLEEVGVELVQSLVWADQVDDPPLQTLAEPCPSGGCNLLKWCCGRRGSSALEIHGETIPESVNLVKTR